MNRRGFLAGILAAGFAPAIGHVGILMPVKKIVTPEPLFYRGCEVIFDPARALSDEHEASQWRYVEESIVLVSGVREFSKLHPKSMEGILNMCELRIANQAEAQIKAFNRHFLRDALGDPIYEFKTEDGRTTVSAKTKALRRVLATPPDSEV